MKKGFLLLLLSFVAVCCRRSPSDVDRILDSMFYGSDTVWFSVCDSTYIGYVRAEDWRLVRIYSSSYHKTAPVLYEPVPLVMRRWNGDIDVISTCLNPYGYRLCKVSANEWEIRKNYFSLLF